MSDLHAALSALKRPRLLVGAARKGLLFYRRDRDLKAALRGSAPGPVADRLLETEARLEEIRQAGTAGYSVSDHIAVLTALIAEAATARRAA
ncbi:MAG: DUF6477 family protein [Pseudomonadota bacterium]